MILDYCNDVEQIGVCLHEPHGDSQCPRIHPLHATGQCPSDRRRACCRVGKISLTISQPSRLLRSYNTGELNFEIDDSFYGLWLDERMCWR